MHNDKPWKQTVFSKMLYNFLAIALFCLYTCTHPTIGIPMNEEGSLAVQNAHLQAALALAKQQMEEMRQQQEKEKGELLTR